MLVGRFALVPGSADAAPIDGPLGPTSPRPLVESAVLESLADTGMAEVVVTLRDGVSADTPDPIMAEAVSEAQERVLGELDPDEFELRNRPMLVPVISGVVSSSGLRKLTDHPLVSAVEFNEEYEPFLAEAVPAVKADLVRDVYGLTGKGVTVAVLDTGIDNNHPDFEGKIIDQHCYAAGTRSCAPDDTSESDNAQDDYGHGTAVSGIILSPGKVSSPGVAPEADLVAVRVFQDTGRAATGDIISGLDFVMRKVPEHDINIVNMSLGGGAGRGVNCDADNPSMKEAFQRLVARKVIIFVATGNNGYTDSVSSPACISNSVAVGATYDVEAENGGRWCPNQKNVTPLTIACFTNRGRAMDLLAPGLFIQSSKLGGGVTNPGAGTSYAAPMAAGVAALILQADPDLRPSEVESVMARTGIAVQHPEDEHIDFPLVDALAAIESLVPWTPTPSVTPTAEPPTSTATGVPPTTTPTLAASPTATATTELEIWETYVPFLARRWFR